MQSPAAAVPPSPSGRPVHWITTAAALAVLTATAAWLGPGGAAAEPPAAPVAGPDPAAADYPVDCGPYGITVTDHLTVDLDGDGVAETVAAVHCDAGAGTPPHGLYLLTAPARGESAPRVALTLVDPAEGMTLENLAARGGTVSVRLLGYSSPDVPRSAPDQRRDVSWEWTDGTLALRAAPPPGSY